MALIDLIGQRFGRLIVTGRAPTLKNNARWRCLCDCGNVTISEGSNLRRGTTQSCGCYARDIRRMSPGPKPVHGRSRTPEWIIWCGMRQRCSDPGSKSWPNYGGRGIKVCDEWLHDFQAFFDHVGPRPGPEYSIDRINNDGDYEPGNVRWATRSEQRRNRRALSR